jgi:hypothetical protein
MPRRKQNQRRRRFNDRIVAQLRAKIRSGDAWEDSKGIDASSVIYVLVTGYDFFDDHPEDELRQVWEVLGDEIIEEHVKHEPATLPWAAERLARGEDLRPW